MFETLREVPRVGLLPIGSRPAPTADEIVGNSIQTLFGTLNDFLRSKFQAPDVPFEFQQPTIDQPRSTGMSGGVVAVLVIAALIGVAALVAKRF